MSKTIDERVVEMRFDNRHFEQNVSQTMSTLDKFKQKLHLDGATKGLENVNLSEEKKKGISFVEQNEFTYINKYPFPLMKYFILNFRLVIFKS